MDQPLPRRAPPARTGSRAAHAAGRPAAETGAALARRAPLGGWAPLGRASRERARAAGDRAPGAAR